MQIMIHPHGDATAIYDEVIDLRTLGGIRIQRASHVEPDEGGGWSADLSPVGGPLLGPFAQRSQALAAELEWLSGALEQRGVMKLP